MGSMKIKVTKKSFILLLDLIVSVVLFVYGNTSLNTAVYFSIITIIILISSILSYDKFRILYSTALEIYIIALQFGLVIPYVLVGRHVISYTDWTLRFMWGPFITQAVYLSNIAVISFELMKSITRAKYGLTKMTDNELDNDSSSEKRKLYVASCVMLVSIVLYYSYFVLFRGTRLFSPYSQFRNSSLFNSSFYHFSLILFYSATLCLTAVWEIRKNLLGWILWVLIIVFYAMNGNKGEFLYAVLAALGTRGVSGKKINWKTIVIILATLFILIPTVTSLRSVGVAQNLGDGLRLNYIGAFTEMGGQIRMTEYGLEDVANGEIKFLWGRSYWQPVWNIIVFPFSSLKSVATAAIRAKYPGYGFSQVIESYINFGVFGVVGYFGLVAYLLARWERRPKNIIQLAYLGSITSILINASRNYFAFVPGHILLVTVIFMVIKKVGVRNGT